MSAPARQTSAERTALQVARAALQSADTAYGIPDAIVGALSAAGLLMDPEIAAVMASAGTEIQRLNERIVELETAAVRPSVADAEQVLLAAMRATHSPSDRAAYALDLVLITRDAPVSTDATYPGWIPGMAHAPGGAS